MMAETIRASVTTEPLMNVTLINNQHENSATVTRADGSRLDFAHMGNELIIGHHDRDGELIGMITLSIQESEVLATHLKSILVKPVQVKSVVLSK